MKWYKEKNNWYLLATTSLIILFCVLIAKYNIILPITNYMPGP